MRCFILFDTTSFVSLLVLTLSHLESVAAFAQCYYPDGSIPTDFLWEPCTGSKFSSCCVPSEGDICQPNGLCLFPDYNILYRGTCTDQTWQDPSCNVGACVSGFETTWQWVGECVSGPSSSTLCGSYSQSAHVLPTCSGNAVLKTAYVTTTSTTSAHRFTPPPPIDTARFSVETDTYTTIITANAQTTTITSTFASTKTNTLGQTITGGAAAATGTGEQDSTSTGEKTKKTITISVATLAGIGIAAALGIIAGVGAFIFVRRKRAFKKNEAIRLDSANRPPPPPANGPVGADQVHPYEAPVNEIATPQKKYLYMSPKVDTYEIDDRTAILREKRSNGVMELGADECVAVATPAPAYHEAIMPVELDGTSSIRAPVRG